MTAPDPVDVHVGAMIRARRGQLRVSQEVLAEHLGLTFQQVQKYERGANRVSASVLWRIAQRLGVQVGYFFDGLAAPEVTDGPLMPALAVIPGGLELARAYLRMDGPGRDAVQAVARTLAARRCACR